MKRRTFLVAGGGGVQCGRAVDESFELTLIEKQWRERLNDLPAWWPAARKKGGPGGPPVGLIKR